MGYSVEKLQIRGFRNELVGNEFLRQGTPSKRLTLVFPGWGYRPQMPLLYWPAEILAAAGSDVLLVDYDYPGRGLSFADESDIRARLGADTSGALAVALAQGSYTELAWVGKSMGTLATALLLPEISRLDESGVRSRIAWLTPVWKNPAALEAMLAWQGPALHVIGTADAHFDAQTADRVRGLPESRLVIVERAGHALELAGDVLGTMDVHRGVMGEVAKFFTSCA